MAKPAHTRVTFEGVVGTVAAPVEHWSFNVNFPSAITGAAATDASLGDKAFSGRERYAIEVAPIMPTDVILTKVRVAHVDATGHVSVRADGSYVQHDNTTTAPGGMAQQPMPLQTALCVSLGTGRAGPTGKGRFFLPWPGLSLDNSTKVLPTAQVEGIIDNLKRFLNGLETDLGDAAVVVSSKGYTSEVTHIRIGRAPDTMRSRREDVPEGYVTEVLHP